MQNLSEPTKELARFIAQLEYEHLPAAIRERVKDIILDTLASAIAGRQGDETKQIRALAGALGASREASVIGGEQLSLAGATLLNGYLITAVTVCDVHRPTLCHTTPKVVPPALAIAVTSAERVAALPDVPTLNESALPGYVAVGWNGLVGPAAIPAPVLEKIHSAVAKIYQQPDMRDKLIGLAAEPAISTPEEFTALVKSEIGKWAKAVKDSGAKLE